MGRSTWEEAVLREFRGQGGARVFHTWQKNGHPKLGIAGR